MPIDYAFFCHYGFEKLMHLLHCGKFPTGLKQAV